jgi:chloride channel protein, CIC family
MGMAAGLSAIFRSPIGTAIFAVEVLYGGMDFEAGALIYCMLAAIVAYAVNGWFVGWQSLFQVPPHLFAAGLADYGWYIALGGASGILASILPEVFYRFRDAFAALPIPAWTKPGIGGLLLGMMALRLPQVLGGGYGWIQEAIDGRLALGLLLVLVVAKMLALSFTVSSGGSGGIFAPSLFVGSMLGGVFAAIAHVPPAGLVIVGMAAVFAGAARVPIATLLMVVEMTGGYQLLVPAGLAVMLSFVIQINLSSFFKYSSLYEAQVGGRSDSPAHIAEHVQIALRLLEQGKIVLPPAHHPSTPRSSVAIGGCTGSSGRFTARDWSASTRESMGRKTASISNAYRPDRGFESCGGTARPDSFASSARNRLTTRRPALNDRVAASSSGVVGAPGTTFRFGRID